MQVNSKLDVTSAQTASMPSKSKGNSTATDTLFGSILGQTSQGSGKTTRETAARQAKSTQPEAVKGADAATRKPISQKDTRGNTNKVDPKDDRAELSDKPEDIDTAEIDASEATDGTNDATENVKDKPSNDGAREETTEDTEEAAEQPTGIKIFLQPAPILPIQAGAMDAVAPPVIQEAPIGNTQTVEAVQSPLMPDMSAIGGEEQLLPEMMLDAQLEGAPKTANDPNVTVQTPLMDTEQMPVAPETVQEEPVLEVETDLASKIQLETEEDGDAPKVAQETSTKPDKAEAFASQVVKEARELVEEQQTDLKVPTSEAEESDPAITVQGSEDAEPDDGDATTKKDDTHESIKPANHNSQNVNTAQVAENGRVDFRLSGAQPLEAQQALPPEVREFNMARVVDQVRTEITPDKTEFYIQLKPDHLGGLSIALVSEDKGVVAKLMTSSQQVHNALQADMTQMIQMLRDKGINVVQMEVIYDQTANAMAHQNDDNQQRQQTGSGNHGRSHGRVGEIAEEPLAMYDTLSSYEVLTEQGGSVEYTA